MIKSIEKLVDIVSNYRNDVTKYHDDRKKLQEDYANDKITSGTMEQELRRLDTDMMKKADDYKAQYKTAFQAAVEATRKNISSPKFASDTGFRNVIETIKDSGGAYDLDTQVLQGMIEPYIDDYAARKLIIKTLDENTKIGSSFFGLHAENPLYILQSLAGREEMEFGSWASKPNSAFRNGASLLLLLENVLDIAKGETEEVRSQSIMF